MQESYKKLEEWIALHVRWAQKLTGFVAAPLGLRVVDGTQVIDADKDSAQIISDANGEYVALPRAHADAMIASINKRESVPYALAKPVIRAVAHHFSQSSAFHPRHGGTNEAARKDMLIELTSELEDLSTGHTRPLDAKLQPQVKRHIDELLAKARAWYGQTPDPFVLITKDENVVHARLHLPMIVVTAGTNVRSMYARAHEFGHFARLHTPGADGAYETTCDWKIEEGKADAFAMMTLAPSQIRELISKKNIDWLDDMRGTFYPEMKEFLNMSAIRRDGRYPSIHYSPIDQGCHISAVVPHLTPQEAIKAR